MTNKESFFTNDQVLNNGLLSSLEEDSTKQDLQSLSMEVTHITTSTDSSGNSYSSTNHYDANWSVTDSAYTDSAGNTSFTQYQTSTDADGNVTGYTHITTSTDSSGNSYSSTNHYDANWSVTDSAYTDSAGNTSSVVNVNNEGIIGTLPSIELADEASAEEKVSVMCICWSEDDLNVSLPANLYQFDDSLSTEIAIVGIASHPAIPLAEFQTI